MCCKCSERIVKMKHNSRRSTELVIAGRTAPSIESIPKPDTQRIDSQPKTNDNNVLLSQIMTALATMNDKFDKISSSNDEIKEIFSTTNKPDFENEETSSNNSELSKISQNIINLHAKVDSTIHSTETKNNIIIQKINELNDKITLPSNHISKFISKDSGRVSLSNANSNRTTPKDPLNWSFSFNHSILPNDNSELYQLLNGFEQNTWTTFDYLRHKLNENTDTILNIESICKKFNSNPDSNSRHHLESPVIDSIKLDTLQSIHDKCESMERNILGINEALNTIPGKSTGMDKQKDAIAQINTQNKVPEQSKFSEQKTLSRNPSAGGPSFGLNANADELGADERVNDTVTTILDDGISEHISTGSIPNSLESRVLNAMSSLDSLNSQGKSTQMLEIETLKALSQLANSTLDITDDVPETVSGTDTTIPSFSDHESVNQRIDLTSSPTINDAGVASIAVHSEHDAGSSRSHSQLNKNKNNPNKNKFKPTNTSALNHEYHLKNLSPMVSEEDVITFILSKTNLSRDDIRVFRLTKKNQDITKLKYVNFKIETSNEISNHINRSDFWPVPCTIAPFIRKGVCNLNLNVSQPLSSGNSDFLCNARVQSITT